MAQFTPRFLDEIRARLTLSEIIGRKVRVTRAGREFKACCPFHKEKTPSFTINDDKNFYHCFGCGAHGDVVGWTMQYENRSFPEAIEQLANQAGLEMPKTSPEEVKRARHQKNLYQLMEDAAVFLEDQLRDVKYKGAYDYIKLRGLDEETLNAFRIGYAGADRGALYKYLKEKDYTDEQMVECGLVRRNKQGNYYSFFRERVMFPVTDKRGRIVAFGGRIVPDSLREEPDRGEFTSPKYINSIDTPLFHKGRMLYGAAHANYAAREGAPLIVTEGYMDVIACHQAGFKGAVAPLGTALTEDQILELWKMQVGEDFKAPILCFDGDNAGRRAAYRAATRALPLLKAGHSLQIMFLPEDEDPDTFLKSRGKDAFQAQLNQARSLIDFLFEEESTGKTFSTPEERAELGKILEDHAHHISDSQVQYHYRSAFREKTNRFFRSSRQTNFQGKSFQNRQINNLPLSKLSRGGTSTKERLLLAGIILNPQLFPDVEERLGQMQCQNQGLERLRQETFAVLSDAEEEIKLDSCALKSHLISVGLEEELQYTLNKSVTIHSSFDHSAQEPHNLLKNWNDVWAS